ncbi:zinc finger, CCHC-type containing protein [Tanacetum coccineum]
MGDANPIRTLGDYSRPSHEGYRNTIELPEGNNVVPLRSDTIRLVQNGCSFHGLRSEDPNQHLKDFLKLVDSLDLDVANRERTRLCLFQFSLRDQASNWLERLPAGSISTWEDLTTRFLAQFFPPGRTAKLRNDILMFQQHQGESLSEAWTRFKDLLQKVPHHGIDLWLKVQIFYDHVNPATRRTIDQSAGGKLRDRNAKESWALLEDLALYDNESWNDPRDFAKPVKAISLPQDVPSTSDLVPTTLGTAWKIPNKHLSIMHPRIPTMLENGLFFTYSSSYQMKLEKALINFDSHQERRLSSLRAQLGQQQDNMISKINLLWKAVSEKLDDTPAQQNRNPSSPKRVHFVNSIIILNKEDKAKESTKSSATEYKDHEMTVESEEEFEEETEEEEEDNPKHF